MSDTPPGAALRLTCQPSRSGSTLVFPYRLANEGPGDVYALQELAAGGAAPGDAAIVIAGDSGDAVVGMFVPPLPSDRRVAVPVVPLARRLAAGEAIEARLEAALPLAETSPYFPDLTLRQYELVDIGGVVLTIAYWPADPNECVARPAPSSPELLSLHPAAPEVAARLATQRFPTRGLQLFRRTDRFPRQVR